MKYKYILFDADDTLLDFSAAEIEAFRMCCDDMGALYSDEIYESYHRINDEYWKMLERGLTTRQKLYTDRFKRLFRETEILPEDTAGDFAGRYMNALAKQGQLLPGAVETCAALSEFYRLYIITNGSAIAQHGRLDESPLMRYVSAIFVSEDMGVSKPAGEFFDAVIRDIGDHDRTAYLVVGDSPTSDIKGAADSGIDSCLVTWGREYGDFGQTYTVRELFELTNILI